MKDFYNLREDGFQAYSVEIIELLNKKERHFVQYFQCHFNLTLPGRHSTIYGPKSPYMVFLETQS